VTSENCEKPFLRIDVSLIHYKTMQSLWSQWLMDVAKRGVFRPIHHHDCRLSKCPLRRIPLYYCADVVCMGPSPPTMGWLQDTIVFFERGGQPECKISSRHPQECPISDKSIYFCLSTGTPHYCGRDCTQTAITGDGNIVCLLTGEVLEISRVTTGLYGDPTPTVSYVPRDTREFTNASLASRALDFVGETRYAPRLEKNFSSYWAHAVMHISALFSPQRFKKEEDEIGQHTISLKQVLDREIRSKQYVDPISLVLLAVNYRKKYAPVTRINMNASMTKQLVPHYATIVLGLWGIMRTVVIGGNEIVKRGVFKDFILASLELYRTGITVRNKTGEYDIELLSPDPILGIVGISEHAKELALPRNISNKNVARLRKKITTSLQETVTIHGVSPEFLRVCEAAAHNNELPDHVFQ
jgi:hypothetical protein